MKMRKLVVVALISLLSTGIGLQAQKIEVKSGSFEFLKGQKYLLVQYDYSNMSVGKYDKETDYIDLKVAEGNAAEPGKGDKWKQEWFGKRSSAYEPSFEELFNKYLEKKELSCSKESKDAAYIINVHTVFTDVGYYIGVSAKPSYISAEITFTKASSGEKMAVVFAEKCPGVGGIKEAYAKLGKSLAAFLEKKL
jgi:hypothetical protein